MHGQWQGVRHANGPHANGRHANGSREQEAAHLRKGMFMRVSSSAAGGEEPGAATAGAACCSAGTARKMGCSMAMGKSSSFMTASCCAPSRLPFTASFASPGIHRNC